MKPVQRSEVLALDEYERVRPHFRSRVIEEKKRRRAKLGPHMSVIFENRDTVLLQIQEMLRTERITKDHARGVLLDISSLEIVDSFMGRMIGNLAAMSRVLDAETVVVGMRPAVAITLVELGLALAGVRTALNVDRGMALLKSSLSNRNTRNGNPAR